MKPIAIALAVALALASLSTYANEAPQDAAENIVAIKLNGNGVASSQIVLQTPDGDVWMSAEDWAALGVILDGQEGMLSGKELGITNTFDAALQSIDLTVPASMLPGQHLVGSVVRVEKVDAQPKGAFVNYDLAGKVQKDGTWAVSVGHDARMGIGQGVIKTTGQLNATVSGVEYRRGITTYQRDNLKSATTLQVGDVFTARSTLTPSVNLAGVRFASDRGLRPGELPYPVPMLGGIAQDASSVDLLVNDTKMGQYQVEQGPYEIGRYPVLRGVNDVELVVRDKFGREEVVSDRFYHSTSVLKKGKTEFDVSAGLVRTDRQTDRYATPAVVANVSRGMSNHWTAGATIQATQDSRNLTLSSTVLLGSLGELSVDASQSTTPQGKGSALAVSYEYNARDWSIRAGHSQWSEDHWSLVDVQGSGVGTGKLKSTNSVGLNLHPRGQKWSAGLAAVQMERGDQTSLRYSAAARYSNQSDDFSAGLIYDATTGDKELGLTWRHSFGDSRAVSAQVKAAPEISTSVQVNGRDALFNHDVRWNAGGAYSKGATSAYANASTQLEKGTLSASARYNEGRAEVSGRFRGSLWIGEGGLTAQGYSPGSFAVVEVKGQEGIPVSSGGGFVSRTNKNGYAVIPSIQPLAPQAVKIDTKNLGLEVGLDQTSLEVVAGRDMGAKVKFQVATETLVEVRLMHNGLPVDPPARIHTKEEEVVVGRGGVAFLEHPQAGEVLTVELSQGQCHARMPDTLGGLDHAIELDCKESP